MRTIRNRTLQVFAASLLVITFWTPPAEGQRLLADGVKDLADQIGAKAKEQQKLRVAVLPFRELEGQPTVLGIFLAEELFTHLVNAGLEIIERSMLDKVLGEIKLDQSGLIDAATAKQVGKVAGVDAVVTGSITDLQSYVAVNCRLIDATTGKIFGAAQAKIVKDDDVRKLMAAAAPSVAAPGGGRGAGSQEAAPEPRKADASQVKVEGDFRFELKGCTVRGTTANCELLITNQVADRELLCRAKSSRLFDGTGNELTAAEVAVGKTTDTYYAASLLVSGIATRSRLRFDGVASTVSEATLLELVCGVGRQPFSVQFRNVPLNRG